MTTTKHTPGPWNCVAKTGIVYGPHDNPDGNAIVCVVGDFRDKELVPFNGKRWAADTRLIAAAPDLLEVMLDLFSNTQFRVAVGGNPHRVDDLLSRARSVIAKATGGTDEQD